MAPPNLNRMTSFSQSRMIPGASNGLTSCLLSDLPQGSLFRTIYVSDEINLTCTCRFAKNRVLSPIFETEALFTEGGCSNEKKTIFRDGIYLGVVHDLQYRVRPGQR